MTLEQLRIFVGVAEREHVTKAAEVLNVTQSAASGAVAALEARYGVPLFHRVGRGIQLTEAGRGFLEEARAVRRGREARVLGIGAILAAIALIPGLNLLVPVIGTAAMTHLLHQNVNVISNGIRA